MFNKNTLTIIILLALAVSSYFFFIADSTKSIRPGDLDSVPLNVTLSGTYVCLPHLDTSGPKTMECAFGLKTDDGVYYAVNFGQSADSMSQFQSGAHITAEGFVVIKEALSTDQWQKYNMKGIFTITKLLNTTAIQGKLNINVICENVLTYTEFIDAESGNKFVAECKEGKHPEVIEQYKKQMGFGEEMAI